MVPETTLADAAARALGLTAFDGAAFDKQIDRVDVCDGNLLRFVFKDGSNQEIFWEDRSRSESWTDEMRAEAGRRAKERKAENG